MRVIDSHMHLGEDLMFNSDDSEEVLLKTMETNGVDGMLLQPGIIARDQKKAHERIHAFAKARPGSFHGLACFSPYIEDHAYMNLVRWAVRDLGFRGVKLHPNAFCMSPTHPAAEKIYRVALELKIPVMIHTGNGLPNALPSMTIPVARRYPNLKIVLAHAGGGTFGLDALVVAQECSNVFLETSWTTVCDLEAMVKKLGPQRVMFGTDMICNVPVELAKYRSLGLSDGDLEWCFAKTVQSVFQLE